MASSPGSPKPGPSAPETAAAWVGLADLVTGLFQFVSEEGTAVDDVAPGAAVAVSPGVPCSASSLGAGARVATGAGAVSAGSGGGAGAGAAGGCSVVGFGRAVRVSFGSGSDRPGRQIRPQVGDVSDVSALAGAPAQRPTESAKTTAAAVAGMARSADGNCFIDTFSTARGPLRASLVLPAVCYNCPLESATTRGGAPNPRDLVPLQGTLRDTVSSPCFPAAGRSGACVPCPAPRCSRGPE
jgi:hypothetical protein